MDDSSEKLQGRCVNPIARRLIQAPLQVTRKIDINKIDNCSANHPEVARNYVRDPCDMIGQSLAGRAARLHRHNEQISFHRLDEVGRGKASVTAKAARFDRHIGLTGGENEFFQSSFLLFEGAGPRRAISSIGPQGGARFIEGGVGANNIEPFARFGRGQAKGLLERLLTVLGIVRDENDLPQRFWFTLRLGKKQDRTSCLANQPSRDITKNRTQNNLFLERTGHYTADL